MQLVTYRDLTNQMTAIFSSLFGFKAMLTVPPSTKRRVVDPYERTMETINDHRHLMLKIRTNAIPPAQDGLQLVYNAMHKTVSFPVDFAAYVSACRQGVPPPDHEDNAAFALIFAHLHI